MTEPADDDEKEQQESMGCWIIIGLVCISIGIGYLFDPGYGWISAGAGIIALSMAIAWQRAKTMKNRKG